MHPSRFRCRWALWLRVQPHRGQAQPFLRRWCSRNASRSRMHPNRFRCMWALLPREQPHRGQELPFPRRWCSRNASRSRMHPSRFRCMWALLLRVQPHRGQAQPFPLVVSTPLYTLSSIHRPHSQPLYKRDLDSP